MKKNIFKKFIVLLSLGFVLFGFNFVFAEDAPVDTPIVTPVNIHLKVISGTDTPIYDNDISVTPCDSDNDPATPDIATPYCALIKAGVLSDWSGLWINSIGGVANDFTNNLFWMWLSNLNIDNTTPTSSYNLSAKQYQLNENDKIIFYYNTNPLNILVDNLAQTVGSDVTISVKELGLDSSWNPVWAPSVGGKIVVGADIFDLDANGEYKLNIISTDPIIIKGQKDGFIDSPVVTINPSASSQGGNIEDNNTDNNVGGGSSGSIPKSFSIPSALSFLSSNQKSDGSFGDSLYTDWGAIAVSLGNDSNLKSSISDYLKNSLLGSSVVTDNERHAMALMALGINPYTGTSVDYIKKITDAYDDTQIGDNNLFNDDIFGLIVLQNSGYTKSDEIIKNTISYVISRQSPDGSWGSVDMTSAGVEALDNFRGVAGVSDAISKAESYLKNSQNPDGGFSNTSSTSWAIQAMSLDSSLSSNVDSAIKYLTDKQQNDGALDGSDVNNRVWITSYAIPAVLKLSWSSILQSFEKPEVSNLSSNNTVDTLPIVEAPKPTLLVEEPKAEIIPVEKEIKIPHTKIVKKQNKKINITEKEIVKEPLVQAVLNNNLLGASAGDFNQNTDISTFSSSIHKILAKIASPFVWLWIHLGF